MGQETCAVIVGFVVVHVGFVLSVVTYYSSHILDFCDNSTLPVNSTVIRVLWQDCGCHGCVDVRDPVGIFHARGLFAAGAALLLASGIGMYVFITVDSLQRSFYVCLAILINLICSNICYSASLILIDLHEVHALFPGGRADVKWPWYTAIASALLSFIATLTAAQRTRLLATRKKGFEELSEEVNRAEYTAH